MAAHAPVPHRRRRWIGLGLGALAIAVLAAAAWVGVRAWLVKGEFDALLPLADRAGAAAAAGDVGELSGIAEQLASHADRARELTGDPVWRAAEALPLLGANLQALRTVAAGTAEMAAPLPELSAALARLEDAPAGTLLDTGALAAATPALDRMDSAMTHASAELADVDADALIEPVANGVRRLRTSLTALAPAVGAFADASHVLPATLGADGERTIVVMVQNPAELRTGGGITGTFAEVRADQGRLTLVRQADSSVFTRSESPVVPVPDTTTAVYGDGVARYVQNASMTPDFALTGSIVSKWWAGLTGRTPDTVVAVDPFILQALLTATGPVEIPSHPPLSADNVIDSLLVQPYLSLSSEDQTRLFADAIAAVFARVADGGLDPFALLRAIEPPVSEGRLSVWSAHPDEAEIFAESSIGGTAARQDAAGDGAFGVFFNDATGGKMARYLDVDISHRVIECRQDDLVEVALTVTMQSTAPPDAGSALPKAVTGGGLFGVGTGDIGTNVTVTAPHDSYIGRVVVKGQPYPAATAVDGGRASSTALVNLSPGEVNVLEFHFLVPSEADRAAVIVHTPLMNAPAMSVDADACADASVTP